MHNREMQISSHMELTERSAASRSMSGVKVTQAKTPCMSAIDPQSQVRRGPDAVDGIKYLAISKSYRRGQEIYGVNDPADFWYRIVSGAARKCLVLIDGRRRIVDFLLPDEFFGFGTRQRHSFYVEAIVKGTVVACYPRRNVQMVADSDSRLSRRLLEVAFEAISSSQARIQILGRVTALEKVSSFLVEMHQRLAQNAGDPIVLPMSRYDIGDYLAISTETVSRALTDLTKRGAITLVGKRRIEIANRVMLAPTNDFPASLL
jgi:CRP/FNR family transcriptional regulator, nitrogen fixation regulation protein